MLWVPYGLWWKRKEWEMWKLSNVFLGLDNTTEGKLRGSSGWNWASLVAQTVKNLPAGQGTRVWFLGREDPLEEEMATHSSIHDWEIPWTEEPGGLQSMGSQRVGHELATKTTSSSLFLSWHLDEPTLYMKRKGTRTFPVMWMEIKPQYCGAPFLFLRLAKDLSSMWRGCRETGKLVYSSVQFTCSLVSNSLRPHEPQHARLLCPSPTPRVYSNSCPLSQWCHPTISFSVIPFSSCPQSFPASGSLQMSQLFTSGGRSIGVSASASVLPMNTQDWSPLGWSGWISLQSKGLSRVFSNSTV